MQDFINSDLGIAFTQALGFLATSAGLISFQMKRRGDILVCQMLCSMLFAVQLAFLGKLSGVIFNVLGMIRAIIYSQRGKYKWADSNAFPIVFIILFVSISTVLAFVESPFALLPAGAMTVISISQFLKRERLIRSVALAASPMWIIYHLLYSHSVGGWAGEIFIMLSIVVSLIRYRGKERNKIIKRL